MKIKNGFVLRTICGESIISGEGLSQVNFSKLVSLNETAAYLWKEVEGKEFDAQALADLLVERYEVTPEVALKDSEALLAKWTEMGLVEE